ncbi:MAG TPA: haloacid dehalogenase-like hydrolase [Gemmatimonadaceae bacterium]|nr:haloacid dehalogenase-like hydrolase [Gemmatimonadaceae bacterium]
MKERRTPRFATVILDVDSTLCGIEGIDWLAERQGEDVAKQVAELTDRAMRGELPLEDVYGARLAMVRPRREDVDALGHEYIETISRGAVEALAEWRQSGVCVILLSSAIRYSILRLALHVGLGPDEVHAVDVRFDALGGWVGYDSSSPLTRTTGKREMVAALDLPRPMLAVGDGSTDRAVQGTADAFAAFTGYVSRPAVADGADFVVMTFDELTEIVLGSD